MFAIACDGLRTQAYGNTTFLVHASCGDDFVDYGVPRMSAALSYYTLFSLAPILLIVITICDVFYGRAAIEGTLFGQIQSFVGTPAARQIQDIISNAANSHLTTFASIVSMFLVRTGEDGE